jgi:hypothetical protein
MSLGRAVVWHEGPVQSAAGILGQLLDHWVTQVPGKLRETERIIACENSTCKIAEMKGRQPD